MFCVKLVSLKLLKLLGLGGEAKVLVRFCFFFPLENQNLVLPKGAAAWLCFCVLDSYIPLFSYL